MSSHKNRDKAMAAPSCGGDEVAAYLREHPDFFEHYPDVLGLLELRHQTGGAASLIERQVAVLRQETRDLRHKIHELVDIARENDGLMAKLHSLSIVLLEADSLDSFIDLLSERLEQDFGADLVAVRLFASPEQGARSRPELIDRDAEGVDLFESILARKKPVCGRFNRQQREFLFGQSAERAASAAVVPLHDMESKGLFAIASSDPERFRAGMSTVFLGYLGEVASAVLKRVG